MYKLFVFVAALLAVAAARPSHLSGGEHLIYSAPAATIIEEPAYAKVGSVVKSIPTAVSHQSQSIVHSHAHLVEDVLAPVVKTHIAPVHHTSYAAAAAPLLHSSYAAPTSYVKSVAALPYSTYAEAAPVLKSYEVPSYAAHTSYAASAPLLKSYATPLTYASPWGYAASAPAHYSSW